MSNPTRAVLLQRIRERVRALRAECDGITTRLEVLDQLIETYEGLLEGAEEPCDKQS